MQVGMATSLNRPRSRRRPRFCKAWSKHLIIQPDSSSNRLGLVIDRARPVWPCLIEDENDYDRSMNAPTTRAILSP
jgi:hypothetical protein